MADTFYGHRKNIVVNNNINIQGLRDQIENAKGNLNPTENVLDSLKDSAFQSITSKLDTLERVLAIQKYKLVMLGTVGSGKTTALCYLLDLLDEERPSAREDPLGLFKEELLVTGAGGSTVCEVCLKLSDSNSSKIETEFISKKELRANLDDFAEFIAAKDDNKEGKIGAFLPQEIIRSIRNITRLGRQRGGGDLALDKYRELGSYERLKEYLFSLVEELPDGERITCCESDSDKTGKKFIKEVFKQINSAEIKGYSIPKKITIYLSRELFGENPIWNDFEEIIDTKGLDGQSGRSDIEVHLNSHASVLLFTSTFPDAPSSDVVYQIKRYTESGFGGRPGRKFQDKSLMLVLPRNEEPANKEGAEGIYEEGLDITKEYLESRMRTLRYGINADRILFFNAKRENGRDGSKVEIRGCLDRVVSTLRGQDGQLDELRDDLRSVLNISETDPADKQALISIIEKIKLLELVDLDMNFGSCYAKKFGEWFPHWNTKHALNKRKGTWNGTDVFFLGKEVFSDLKKKVFSDRKETIVGLLESQEWKSLQPLIKFVKEDINRKLEEWYEKLQDDFAGRLRNGEFRGSDDNPFWDRLIHPDIRGEGYNQRVLDAYKEQLSEAIPSAAYNELWIKDKWEELLKDISDALGEESLKGDTRNMMKYEWLGLEVEKFEGISKIENLDIPPGSKCVILTGENGYGKTSILKAILAGFVGRNEKDFRLVESSDSRITVKYRDFNEGETKTHQLDDEAIAVPIVAYGASRGMMGGE